MASVPKALAASGNCFLLPAQQEENQGVPQAQHLLPVAGGEQPAHHNTQFLGPMPKLSRDVENLIDLLQQSKSRMENVQLRSRG